jgi:hypothetical protein
MVDAVRSFNAGGTNAAAVGFACRPLDPLVSRPTTNPFNPVP